MGKISKINWQRFKELVSKLIRYKTQTTSVPVRAESWEEVIYAVLLYMEYKVVWEPTSHAKGVDIKVKINGDELGISAKGGKVVTNDRTLLTISSYRLTRYGGIESMLEFLRENAEKIDIYLICAREEKRANVKYRVFRITAHELVPDEMLDSSNWEEDNQAWVLTKGTKKGLEARIVKKMSNQLWYTISLNYPPLETLVEVTISKKEIGVALVEVLKSLDK